MSVRREKKWENKIKKNEEKLVKSGEGEDRKN